MILMKKRGRIPTTFNPPKVSTMKAQSIGVMRPGILERVIRMLNPVVLLSCLRDLAMRRVVDNMVNDPAKDSMTLKGIVHQR